MRRHLALLVALVAVLPSAVARARKPSQLQQHEVTGSVDLEFGQERNNSIFDFRYVFTPEGIDRRDIVLPGLRRFVLAPDAFWVRAVRDAGQDESETSLRFGGVLFFAGARLFASAELGLEVVREHYDIWEDGFIAAPLQLELGGRPLPLLSLSAIYRARRVLFTTENELPPTAERSGHEQEIGGSLTFATPNDRLFGGVELTWHAAEWDFVNKYDGAIVITGLGGVGWLSVQLTPTMSLQLRVLGRREDWRNRRAYEGDAIFFLEESGSRNRRTVNDVGGELSFIYWFEGEIGLKVSLGGGYEETPPYRLAPDSGLVRLGFGITRRF